MYWPLLSIETYHAYFMKRPMSTKNVEMTSAQCRAARALIQMTQTELAEAAGVGLSTVVDFEKERRIVSAEAVAKLKSALEQSHVVFLNADGAGEGVSINRRSA